MTASVPQRSPLQGRESAQNVRPGAKVKGDALIDNPDLTFTMLLDAAGLARRDVRLLRLKDGRYPEFPSLYTLWRDQRPRFDAYQETQAFGDAPDLRAPIWASFVGLPGSTETLFVGMYEAELVGPLPADRPHPITGRTEPAGSCNLYRPAPMPILSPYIGRLWIRWGGGYRQWVQRVDGSRAGKPIVELRRSFSEDAFPGSDVLILNLADIETIPVGWQAALTPTRGIYLLTCPRTREQYVGMASGAGGFLARWRDYFVTGHGGNVALKSREASDYRISILETVGSAATDAELMVLEARWKDKLQSREMGLNRNLPIIGTPSRVSIDVRFFEDVSQYVVDAVDDRETPFGSSPRPSRAGPITSLAWHRRRLSKSDGAGPNG